ncbi:hypothetical protein AYO47_08255 [Planctomyces sp. SCGC AG-212-M04]|nr:hypothetical protein AYO47_08255 [Planctomyces sp. SCGC AG-212-M04]
MTNAQDQSLRVIQTIASTREDHGGTSRSVPRLCDALADQCVDVHLIAGTPADPAIGSGLPRDPSRAHTVPESAWIRQMGVTRGFRRYLDRLSEHAGSILLHDHGVWLPTNHAVARYAFKRSLRRIVSPRGMLSAWSLQHGSWKKRVAWTVYQWKDLQTADAFHATAAEEAEDLRSLGLKQPIAVIPNGVSFPPSSIGQRTRNADGLRTALFLSRVHPKKNLPNLLRAWKNAEVGNGWRLVIAGPDENRHVSELRRLASELRLDEQVEFRGPADDVEKWKLYRDADLFVLPSFSENFGLVIAEALASGLPVITTTGTPWKAIADEGFGWHVDPSVESLTHTLREATSLSVELLEERGLSGRRWIGERYSWTDVGRRMSQFYQWLTGRGERPDFVV